MKSTKQHASWWANRKINWSESYTSTINHPHRDIILEQLRQWQFGSIYEIGCASGPNLFRIQQAFPRAQVGGSDINEEAITAARTLLGQYAILQCDPVWNIFHSDKSTDITLSDACLIYVGSDLIDKTLEEIKRVTRLKIIFVEFHSKSFIKRLGLKFASGYNAYNWNKLLDKHGFYDIEIKKLPDLWGGEPWKTFGHIITASV